MTSGDENSAPQGNGASSSSASATNHRQKHDKKQPFQVAEDQYQAPFQLPSKKQANDTADDTAFDSGSPPIPSSPYFDEQESREAIEWARSQQAAAIDDLPEAGEHAGGVGISTRRRRDSQVGSYDEHGSIFDGPTAGAVPSSVSR